MSDSEEKLADPAPPEDCRISINAGGWAATPGCPFFGTSSAGCVSSRSALNALLAPRGGPRLVLTRTAALWVCSLWVLGAEAGVARLVLADGHERRARNGLKNPAGVVGPSAALHG